MEDESENTDYTGSSNLESEVDESEESILGHDNGFFDLEASESSGSDDEPGNQLSPRSESVVGDQYFQYSFPQFPRLPIELRLRIWEFFCPDFAAKSRVFKVDVNGSSSDPVKLVPDPTLDQQTAPARVMLATHRESRSMALKIFPDTLNVCNGHGVIPFNKDKDLVYVGFLGARYWTKKEKDDQPQPPFNLLEMGSLSVACFQPWSLAGFTDTIQHLVISSDYFVKKGRISAKKPVVGSLGVFRLILTFPNLKTIYTYSNDYSHKRKDLEWCVSDSTRRYYYQTSEIEPGLGEDLQSMFCWPNPKENMDYTRFEIPIDRLQTIASEVSAAFLQDVWAGELAAPFYQPLAKHEIAQLRSIDILPLIAFEYDEGLNKFDKLWERNATNNWEPDSDSSAESYSDSDRYESGYYEGEHYESDGIDDSNRDDDSEIDDDEDPPSDMGSDLGGIPLDWVNLPPSELGENYSAAQFSSPDPESSSSDQTAALDSTAPDAPTRMAKRANRRIITSDSEGDSDEEVVKNRNSNRRPRIILTDEEEEDDAGGGISPTKSPSRSGSSQGDSSQGEDSDEVGDKNKPISLAERLQLHRQENPISSPGSDDGFEAEASGGDYDASNYADREDSNGDEGLEDTDDGAGHAMIVGAGEESDEESGW